MQALQFQDSRKKLIEKLVGIIEELTALLKEKEQRILELEEFIGKLNQLTYSQTKYNTGSSLVELQRLPEVDMPISPKFKSVSEQLTKSLKENHLKRQLRLASLINPNQSNDELLSGSQPTQQVEIDVINSLQQSPSKKQVQFTKKQAATSLVPLIHPFL